MVILKVENQVMVIKQVQSEYSKILQLYIIEPIYIPQMYCI